MDEMILETHPWEPFIPDRARILIMGTFPPAPSRWSMDFYYPNRINDFWRIMGLVFYNDRDRFWNALTRSFRLEDIRRFLTERAIALNDTGRVVRRLKGNASDKYLEIVTPVDLKALLDLMPTCHAVATTGEKAAGVVAELTGTVPPKMGEKVQCTTSEGRKLTIYRMPSTSRAYPLAIDKKAAYYASMFREIGIL